jgi:nitroimidazol reductase NimA-like FMN-containing flavoprotein (pyridoxamine 5'-phosphate oxidase superfamily)
MDPTLRADIEGRTVVTTAVAAWDAPRDACAPRAESPSTGGTFGPARSRLPRFAGHKAPVRTPGSMGDAVVEKANDSNVWELSEEECWNLLARGELGRLALAVNEEPEIFPVNYVVDGPRVFFRTAPGSKLAELTVNPRVAFEVDEYDETYGASVVLKGVAKRLELQREIDAADALPLTPWIPTLKYRWVRIAPVSITGRRFERGPEPDRYVASANDA